MYMVSYGHTSHGSQIIAGIQYIYTQNNLYAYNRGGAIQQGVLSIADYTPSGDLGNPDYYSWATRTRSYLNTPGNNRNAVMWSWCGQVSGQTQDELQNNYLTLMPALEVEYPNHTFIYMTGHLDGSGPDGNLYQRNNQIRNYVRQNNKVLFDFADIESYDPAGNYYPNESDDCNWCYSWCTNHPNDCLDLPSCAHSHGLNCVLKGKAFWVMMAMLAGWNSSTLTPMPTSLPTLTPSPTSTPTSTPTPTFTPTPMLIPGDTNGDGHVNEADYTIWLYHYRQSTAGLTDPQKISQGDFNKDNTVNGADYVIWLSNYGK